MSANAEQAATANERKFSIPWDISEWLDRSSLLAGVVNDVESLDWGNPDLRSFLQANPEFQLKLLLVLVTYAYAMGVCESEDVVDVYYGDAELKKMFPKAPPGPAAITRFRRENRGLLKWSIGQTFKRAVRARHDLGEISLPPGLKKALMDAASARIDVGRHLDRAVEAE
jgi:hypothetical protein